MEHPKPLLQVCSSVCSFRLGVWRYLLTSALLVVVADYLFWDHPIGISLVIYLAINLLFAVFLNLHRSNIRTRTTACLVCCFSLAPMIEAVSILSIAFAVIGVLFALAILHRHDNPWTGGFATTALRHLMGRITRPLIDLQLARKHYKVRNKYLQDAERPFGIATTWIIPILFAGLFLSLFVGANPVLENWLIKLNFVKLFDLENLLRLVFWLTLGYLTWPMLRPRIRHKNSKTIPTRMPTATVLSWQKTFHALFSPPAILRSLLIFNVLFAGQTVMDVAYLWGGLSLPENMTYADYAHRGAYPLVATALLAAVFVLIALRPGSASEKSRPIRFLVYGWIAQNILLVFSSILRLDLYVEFYALTYLRIGAFIWMILVALGLLFVVARIIGQRNGVWLVRMNLGSLLSILYICCFINFAEIISEYNVTHSRDISGSGVGLDLKYMARLGPQALPSLNRYVLLLADQGKVPTSQVAQIQMRLKLEQNWVSSDWRGWNFRRHRLNNHFKR